MTKLKSRKISKQSLAMIVMSLVVIASLMFGASTLAYFTDSAESGYGSVTIGTLDISASGTLDFNVKTAVPGTVLHEDALSIDMGATNIDTYLVMTVDTTGTISADTLFTFASGWQKYSTDVNGETTTTIYIYTTTTTDVNSAALAPIAAEDASTDVAITTGSFAIDKSVTDANLMGDSFTIRITINAVQADYINTEGDTGNATGAEILAAIADPDLSEKA